MSLAYAQPPFDQPQVTGELVLSHNPMQFHNDYEDLIINVGVFNSTGIALTNTSTSCMFMLHTHMGIEIMNQEPIYNASMMEWSVTVNSTLLSKNEDYYYSVYCNTSSLGGQIKEPFAITVNGKEPQSATGLIIGILGVCAVMLGLAFKIDEEHYFLKLLLILSVVPLLILVPFGFYMPNTPVVFYNAVVWFNRIFWTYVFVYLTWWIYKKYFMDKRMLEP